MHAAISLTTVWAETMAWLVQCLFPRAESSDSAFQQDDRMPDASHANPPTKLDGTDPHAIVDDVRTQGEAMLVRVHGEIDINRSPDLRGRLLRILKEAEPMPKRLILNLTDVPYMDSSAVAVLVQTLQLMREGKGIVCLTNVQPRVKGILEIARLESIFKVCADETAALSA